MTAVVDASAVVSALVDSGPTGEWALSRLNRGPLLAPHLMQVEVANVLRRAEATGEISADVASLALRDLVDLTVEFAPFEPFAPRAWELRDNLTSYDAWYVALAESAEVSLVTLDRRLASAPGPTCEFELPESSI